MLGAMAGCQQMMRSSVTDPEKEARVAKFNVYADGIRRRLKRCCQTAPRLRSAQSSYSRVAEPSLSAAVPQPGQERSGSYENDVQAKGAVILVG